MNYDFSHRLLNSKQVNHARGQDRLFKFTFFRFFFVTHTFNLKHFWVPVKVWKIVIKTSLNRKDDNNFQGSRKKILFLFPFNCRQIRQMRKADFLILRFFYTLTYPEKDDFNNTFLNVNLRNSAFAKWQRTLNILKYRSIASCTCSYWGEMS